MDETLRGQTVRVVCAAFPPPKTGGVHGSKPGVVRGEVEDDFIQFQVRRTFLKGIGSDKDIYHRQRDFI